MADALEYVVTKWGLDRHARRCPIEIPNTGRVTLARLFGELGFTRGAEIGVERGEFSEVLCRENPVLTLHAVDAWRAYPGYRDHVNQAKLDGFYAATVARLAPLGAQIHRGFSADVVQTFPDGSLDFVYLDANHAFPFLTADLAAWSAKVRPGGIVAGHDYRLHRWPNQIHVVQVLHGWTDAYEIHPWFVLGTKAKRAGQIRDDGRSWFWVHEPRPTFRKGHRPIQQ